LLGDRPGLDLRASVVHRPVETAEALNGLPNQAMHAVIMAHIGAHELGFSTTFAQFLGKARPTSSRRPETI
jgi:hypothetical protein